MNINTICQMTTNSELLNALHACRESHPLNHPKAFHNALALAKQNHDISNEAVGWLAQQIKN